MEEMTFKDWNICEYSAHQGVDFDILFEISRLKSFSGMRVLVLGDVIVDEYIYCDDFAGAIRKSFDIRLDGVNHSFIIVLEVTHGMGKLL